MRSGDEGYYLSLALDDNNLPHISYVRWYNPNGIDLKYAFYDGNIWNISVVNNSLWNSETSRALDNNNTPRISYSGGDSSYTYLKYATLIGSTWQFENIDQNGRFTALAIDSQNHPHIAYQQTEVDDFKYAYFNGTSWSLQTIDTMYASGQGQTTPLPPIPGITRIFPIARMLLDN